MKHEYKVLNKIETHLITWGDPFDCNGKDIIVCVTGNPGIPDFYVEFASKLFIETDIPVCVIGQAGHEYVPDKMSNCLKNQHHLFNLKGQLQHKLDLIDSHVNKMSKLHLIGHSIGAWELVELMDQHPNLINRVLSINLLFPTLQKMGESKNGTFLNNFTRRVHSFLLLLFYFVYYLPVKVTLINFYLRWNSLPLEYNSRIQKFLNPYVGEKVLFLAYDEMDTVKELNLQGLDKIKHFSNVVYSVRDDWVPLPYINDLRVLQPHLQLEEVDINHTFVMKSSIRVANIVIKFIKQKKLESVN